MWVNQTHSSGSSGQSYTGVGRHHQAHQRVVLSAEQRTAYCACRAATTAARIAVSFSAGVLEAYSAMDDSTTCGRCACVPRQSSAVSADVNPPHKRTGKRRTARSSADASTSTGTVAASLVYSCKNCSAYGIGTWIACSNTRSFATAPSRDSLNVANSFQMSTLRGSYFTCFMARENTLHACHRVGVV